MQSQNTSGSVVPGLPFLILSQEKNSQTSTYFARCEKLEVLTMWMRLTNQNNYGEYLYHYKYVSKCNKL